MAFPRPGMTCTLAAARRPEARQYPSAIAMTVASCRPRTNLSCGKSGTTSMIASSVVPGLPKRWVTPSSTSSCKKALRPVIFVIPGFWHVERSDCALVLLSRDQTEDGDGNQGAVFFFRSEVPPRGQALSAGSRARSQSRHRVLPRLRRRERRHAARALDAARQSRLHRVYVRLPGFWRQRGDARTPRSLGASGGRGACARIAFAEGGHRAEAHRDLRHELRRRH